MSDRKQRAPRTLAERMQHHEALIALRAFGEAIATVARARLVSRVVDGRLLSVKIGSERVAVLRAYHDHATVHAYDSMEAWYFERGRLIQRFEGQPEDIAAEAVARLLEEVGL